MMISIKIQHGNCNTEVHSFVKRHITEQSLPCKPSISRWNQPCMITSKTQTWQCTKSTMSWDCKFCNVALKYAVVVLVLKTIIFLIVIIKALHWRSHGTFFPMIKEIHNIYIQGVTRTVQALTGLLHSDCWKQSWNLLHKQSTYRFTHTTCLLTHLKNGPSERSCSGFNKHTSGHVHVTRTAKWITLPIKTCQPNPCSLFALEH